MIYGRCHIRPIPSKNETAKSKLLMLQVKVTEIWGVKKMPQPQFWEVRFGTLGGQKDAPAAILGGRIWHKKVTKAHVNWGSNTVSLLCPFPVGTPPAVELSDSRSIQSGAISNVTCRATRRNFLHHLPASRQISQFAFLHVNLRG